MQEYIVNRPDPNAMKQILEKNFENAAGVILRLAWQAGLLRDFLRREDPEAFLTIVNSSEIIGKGFQSV